MYKIEQKRDKDGNLHCDDGPATITENGFVEWWFHGKCHREDGPAVYKIDDYSNHLWVLDNTIYTFESYCEKMNITGEDKLMMRLKYCV